MSQWALAIGPTVSVHLQQAEIDAQLDFVHAVFAGEPPHHDLAGLIIPVFEQGRDVEVHSARSMVSAPSQVNGAQREVIHTFGTRDSPLAHKHRARRPATRGRDVRAPTAYAIAIGAVVGVSQI